MLIRPRLLVGIEGGFILALSLISYRELHSSWVLFGLLLLVPDLSIAGYLASVRIGAIVYNLAHTLTGPLILIGYAMLTMRFQLLPYGIVWTAHIGMDRMFSFGLKYPTRFNDTHLQHI